MDRQPRAVKPISGYFKDAFKFYDLDKPWVARMIFVLMLAVLFGGYLFARPYVLDLYTHYEQLYVQLENATDLDSVNKILSNSDIYRIIAQSFFYVFLIIVAIRLVSFLLSLFFGSWYYFELTNPQMPGAKRVSVYFSRLPKIILFNFLFYGAIYLVTAVLAVLTLYAPALALFTSMLPIAILIISTLYVFKDLLIIEFNVGVFRNFKKALELTRFNRKNIIINMMCLYALNLLLNMFSIDVNNAALSLFISAFLECILTLISQRLAVLMFLDAASLERKDEHPPLDDIIV